MDFTYPPPTHPHGIWLQAFPNAWQTQFHMPSPTQQANTTVTNTTTCYNNPSTFSSSSNTTTYSSYRPPFAYWRSFNNSALQQTPYQYGNTPSNNYQRQFSQNANGNFFDNSKQNPQTSSSLSTQNWPQFKFNQRPLFIPRQRMLMNRPHFSVRNQSKGTKQKTINAMTEDKKWKHELKSKQSEEPQRTQKPWNREDSVKAIAVEMEFRRPRNNQIMIRFPDHEITQEIVQNFHTGIKSVHFQTPTYPRCCYVEVQPSANIENVANALNKTFFQHEKLKVEIKKNHFEKNILPESIDPYTLYLANLAPNITYNAVKDEFPKAIQINIGVATKKKFTRCAFIKFSNVEDAIQAYKEKYNLVIKSRLVMLRFRRIKENVSPPEQVDKLLNEKNEFDIQSLQKKIKREPIEENIDEYDSPPINVSRVVKPEMVEEDEYEDDSKYESIEYENDINIKSEWPDYENDINIKSEWPDYENEYDEQYYEEEDTDVSNTFRRNETEVKDEYRQCNEKLDDKDEFDIPYSFISKNQALSENNKDIILPKTDEINDGGSDKEVQKWNNYSDIDNDDDGGAEYNWGGLN